MYDSMPKNLAPLLLSVAAVAIALVFTASFPSDPSPIEDDTRPPVAEAGPDMTVDLGDRVTFDGSGSTDDRQVTGWRWSFEYDGERVALDGRVASFAFDLPGNYHVVLDATDAAGNVDADVVTVTVVDAVEEP